MNVIRSVIVFCLFINTISVVAQQKDTLAIVKQLNTKEQYREACELLQVYHSKHREDPDVAWLLAQTLHYSGDYFRSRDMYESTIQQFPDKDDIKLDLINSLIEVGELSKAIDKINQYLPDLPAAYKSVAHKTLAQIFYWKGEYDQSITEIDRALAINSNDQSAVDLKNNISRARSNWVEVDLGYFVDDQPLTKYIPNVRTSFYLNSRLSLGVEADHSLYSISDTSYSTTSLNASARYNFLESKAGLKVEVGAIYFSSKEKSLRARIELNKKMMKYMNVVLSTSYQPYLATTHSIKEKLMQSQYGAAVEWTDPQGFIGRASFDHQLFSRIDNSYYTASGWLVSPPLKLKIFDFRVGYGVNYSDSKYSNFESLDTLDDILAVWDPSYQVQGNYNPLFTPEKQLIHSAVGIMECKPTKQLTLAFDISYGFSAKSHAPYLYLDRDSDGMIEIARDFSEQRFKPMDANVSIHYKISEAFSLKGYYKYQEFYFYESDFAGIEARIFF